MREPSAEIVGPEVTAAQLSSPAGEHGKHVEELGPETVDPISEQRVQILLAEYHETIETLRNWDTIIYQMLAIVSSVIAAIVAFMAEARSSSAWVAIIGLILFWALAYLWQYKLANQRIETIRVIEDELNMKGQYRRVEGFKKKNRFARLVNRISP